MADRTPLCGPSKPKPCPYEPPWVHTSTHGFAIITKDEDFAQWTLVDRPGQQIIWLRIGNCTNTELIHWLMPMWLQVISALQLGERLIEID